MKKNDLRIEITTKDRVGMALDILTLLFHRKYSINSLEVFPEKVYIKIENVVQEDVVCLIEEIEEIEDIVEVSKVELLPYESNERKLLAIIDSVDEGIIAMNSKEEIEIFNSYCEKVFNYKKQEVVGKSIRKILPGNIAPMLGLLKDDSEYNNIEIKMNTPRGELHYITTGRSIKDDEGRTVGAVASIRDSKKVMEMAKVVGSSEEAAFSKIIGQSKVLDDVKRIIRSVASSTSTVLIRGESGTGKELFAKAIHDMSKRNYEKFIAINCAALPENLLESELFGYEEGSFTGGIKGGKDGLFKEASGGTLFLDEIGELTTVLQAKLLRVLQEGKVRKIGGTKEESVDLRVIAATNRDLESMIKNDKFREDLYYRLNVIPIYLPPLRNRKEDIPKLLNYLIEKLSKKIGKEIRGYEHEFLQKLLEHSWPGNIRELENVVERAINLSQGEVLKSEDVIMGITGEQVQRIDEYISIEENKTLKEVVEEAEKKLIEKNIHQNRSLREIAKILEVSHTTIANKLKKYNLECKK